jgi:hypothetical protein
LLVTDTPTSFSRFWKNYGLGKGNIPENSKLVSGPPTVYEDFVKIAGWGRGISGKKTLCLPARLHRLAGGYGDPVL